MMVFTKHKVMVLAVLVFCFMFLQVRPRSAEARTKGAQGRAKQTEAPPAALLKGITVFGGLPAPFLLDAKAALLVDAKTGALLYAYNEHEQMQPASLAKLMTFYLALEAVQAGRVKLDTMVAVSEQAWRLSMDSSVSRMFLRVGETVSVQDLLYGLMVSSGNDAAVALAEHLGGSTDAFTGTMNEKAKELGLTESRFGNPDGLPVPGQHTTASDMAILARALLDRFPDAVTYTGTKEFTFQKIRQPNFNSLLFHDARVDGLKTGHVREAGYHLVATAREGEMRLIASVLGTPNSEKRRLETEKLLSWGFRTFRTVTLDWKKETPESLRVYGGEADQVAVGPDATPWVTVPKGQEKGLGVKATFPSMHLVAPVSKGAVVGELTITTDGNPLSSIPIKTQAEVGPGGFFKRLIDRVKLAF
ncbi:MAG: D-alanyl-D-alanine carboxypeptidase [Desulfobacteraceae bacterium]|nr:MAG: D-alanyl-D-alanine carboxypeptidase [Desulfobacteraceae bacterium]